ncbi:MAG: macro domain-containing protein [Chloroflexales bacterium]|nr:macro domain-containing protein [Chloroflexales bacterium]
MATPSMQSQGTFDRWPTQIMAPAGLQSISLERVAIGNSQLAILAGNLVECQAEGLVCYASTSLALHSVVAARLVELGGASIRSECAKHLPVQIGDAVVISAGKLPARYVLVAVTNHIKSAPSIESIRSGIVAVLNYADCLGLTSLALPTIRASKQIAADDALLAVLTPIINHLSGPTTLAEVTLVVDEVEAFPLLTHSLPEMLARLVMVGNLRVATHALYAAEQTLEVAALPPYLEDELRHLRQQQLLLQRDILTMLHDHQRSTGQRYRESYRIQIAQAQDEIARLEAMLSLVAPVALEMGMR